MNVEERLAVMEAGLATAEMNIATLQSQVSSIAGGGVPTGAVMAFALPACPPGWSSFDDAAGRVVVGTGPGLALNARVGSDAVTLSVAQMPSHAHGVSDPGHSHVVANTINYNIAPTFALGSQGIGQATINSGTSTTGIGIQNAGGGQPFDNRQASVALLYCRKS